MAPIVQRMGLLQKRAATTRQMMPTVIKCSSHARGKLSDATLSVVVAGQRFDMDLDEVEQFLAERSG
jgi:hypothetical protein